LCLCGKGINFQTHLTQQVPSVEDNRITFLE
jgi:hypothetical protein